MPRLPRSMRRFSLRTLMILLTVVALGVVLQQRLPLYWSVQRDNQAMWDAMIAMANTQGCKVYITGASLGMHTVDITGIRNPTNVVKGLHRSSITVHACRDRERLTDFLETIGHHHAQSSLQHISLYGCTFDRAMYTYVKQQCGKAFISRSGSHWTTPWPEW